MIKKKILILGASGLLGRNCVQTLGEKYDIVSHFHQKSYVLNNIKKVSFNLFNKSQVIKFLNKFRPNIVINASGFTNVEKCESQKKKAYQINVIINDFFSKLSSNFNFKYVSISSDHLFNDNSVSKNKKFKETDVTYPLNYYAKTKIIAEKKILNNCNNFLIIRTNFFGKGFFYRKSFSDLIIERLIENKNCYLFKDVFYTPISIKNLIYSINYLIKKNKKGIFNISCNEKISKYKFGILIAKYLNLNSNLIKPIFLNKKKLVMRPKNMALSNKKIVKLLPKSFFSIKNQIKSLEKKYQFSEFMPYGKHSINNADIEEVKKTLKSNFITQGPKIKEFEEKVAKLVGSKYAVAVSSASAGLHLSSLALNLKKGDTMITSPITFVSSANAALHCGAKVEFSDIDIETINLSYEKLKSRLEKNKKIKLVMPVHFSGLPCNMKKIHSLKKKYNFEIIEDASHALGAKYFSGEKVGSCKYSIATVFSFHPVKIAAAGEGGMITTNNRNFYETLLTLRSHGITKDHNAFKNKKFKGLTHTYEMQKLGFNYRITDIQATLAISQINRLDDFLKKRKKIAKIYDDSFKNLPNIQIPQFNLRNYSSNHLYIIMIDFKKIGISRNELMFQLKKRNIGSQVHYIPVPMHPYYKKKTSLSNIKNAKNYYENCLSIPIYYDLKERDLIKLINKIKYFLN